MTLLRGITGASKRASSSGTRTPVGVTGWYSGSPCTSASTSRPPSSSTIPNVGSSPVVYLAMRTGGGYRPTYPGAVTAVPLLPGLRVLEETEWRRFERTHQEQVDAWTAGRRARAVRGQRHPVDDFLWTYYSHLPRQLRRWHPGAGVALAGLAASARTGWRWYRPFPEGVAVDVEAFVDARGESVRFVRDLLAATASRPAHLGCFGLHEWAMV